MNKLLLSARDVWTALGEGRTLFYSERGSYHDQDFPAPLRRNGRAPQWWHADVEEFAAMLAARYRAPIPDQATAPATRSNRTGRRGRPPKPRPFAGDHQDGKAP